MGALTDLLLLTPAGLWGLAAIAVPVAIHLVNRSRGKRVLVGNVALIRAARRRRASEIRLEQWFLLLVRILILTLAALLLARLAMPGLSDQPGDVTYVTPGGIAGLPATAPGGAGSDQAERRLLAPGYPRVETTGEAAADALSAADAWPLLAERLATIHHMGRVTVVTGGEVGEFGDVAPVLAAQPNWSVATRDEVNPPPAPAFRVVVLHDGTRPDDLVQVEKALATLRRHRLPGLQWESVAAGEDGQPPPGIIPGPGSSADVRLLRVNQIASRLDDPGFPPWLLDHLLSSDEQAGLFSHSPIDPDVLPVVTEPDPAMAPATRPFRALQPWLVWALIGLWGLERWLSERRRG